MFSWFSFGNSSKSCQQKFSHFINLFCNCARLSFPGPINLLQFCKLTAAARCKKASAPTVQLVAFQQATQRVEQEVRCQQQEKSSFTIFFDNMDKLMIQLKVLDFSASQPVQREEELSCQHQENKKENKALQLKLLIG